MRFATKDSSRATPLIGILGIIGVIVFAIISILLLPYNPYYPYRPYKKNNPPQKISAEGGIKSFPFSVFRLLKVVAYNIVSIVAPTISRFVGVNRCRWHID